MHSRQGLFFHTLGIVLLAAGCTMGYGLALVVGVSPWWSPQYLIPVLGMVLGNTISGISVGLAAVMEELTTGGEGRQRLAVLAGRLVTG
jgi:putative ABC transport system permease protein